MALSPAIDITAEQRKTLLALLAKHLPNTAAWVYGSRAKWTSRPQSDLDMVVFASPQQNGRVNDLREAFEESNLPFRVDLFVWDNTPEQFRKQIEAEHAVLAEKKEWIVNSDWATVTLGNFAPFFYGKGLRKDTRNSAGQIPVFGSNGHVDWHDEALTDGPTVIIGRKGTVGAIHYSPVPCWPIDTTFFISGGDLELMRFKYYALAALGLEAMNTDSAVPGLNRDTAHAQELRVPPLREQCAIARILGTLDDKIELNRRMNETLEAMTRALFRSWFVDFDPVRAKMAGRDPALPPAIAALFPNRMVNSELRDVPEGWQVKALEDELSDLVSGQRPRGGAVNVGVPSIGAENVIGLGVYNYASEKYVPADFFARLRDKGADVRNGDVLLYKDGASIGRKTYFGCGFPHAECAVNEHVFILRLRAPEAQRYLFFWLDQPWMTQRIVALNSNSAQPGINKTGVRGLPLLLPPTGVLAAFDAQAGAATDKIFANCRESRKLAALRDILLPKLMSGELRVK